jgi:hypothetical protein
MIFPLLINLFDEPLLVLKELLKLSLLVALLNGVNLRFESTALDFFVFVLIEYLLDLQTLLVLKLHDSLPEILLA